MWLRLTTICSGCEGEGFEFVGAVGLSGEVCFCFSGVGFFACGKVGVFGVIEHQVFHAEHFGLLSGIECGAVVLVVGAELFAVAIEAEGFAEEPVAVAHIGFISLVERFVAQAHHALPVGHEQPESILHGFGGAQIEASHIHIIHHQLFTIVHFLQDDALAYGAVNFSRDKESANGFECVFHLAVAVNEEFARVFTFVDEW